MLSMKYSSLLPCGNRESQSATNSQPSNDTNQSLSECNNTESNQQAFRGVDGCSCMWKDDSENCTSLEEAISNLYTSIDVDADTPYQFFTLKDLYYSAILKRIGNGDPELEALNATAQNQRDRTAAELRCRNLEGRYNFSKRDTDMCTWHYNCTQRPAQFPSFYLEASLDSTSSNETCAPLVTSNIRFVRTVCGSNNRLPHWLQCDCGSTVVGYRRS